MTQPTAKPPTTPPESESAQPAIPPQPPSPPAPSASVSVKPDIDALAGSVVLRMCSAADETLSDEELRQLSQAIWKLQKDPPSPTWTVEEEIKYVAPRMGEHDVVIAYDVRVYSGKTAFEVARNHGSLMLKNILLPNMVVNSISAFKEQCNGGIIQPVHSEFQTYLEDQLVRKPMPPERGMLLPDAVPPVEGAPADGVPGNL